MTWNFKPSVFVRVSPHYRGEFEDDIDNGYLIKSFKTYAELKKQIKFFLKLSYTDEIIITRHRRGEWGEWSETWSLIDGKPKIIKQGWL